MTDPNDGKPKGDDEPKGDGDKPATIKLGPEGKEYTAEQIEEALKKVGGIATQYKDELEEAGRKLAAAEARLANADANRDRGKGGGREPVDPERLSRKDLVEHIVDVVSKRVGKPLLDRLDEMEAGHSRKATEAEILELEKNEPNFWEWDKEVKAVLEKHPDLNITDALTLAKSKDPKKVERLDALTRDKDKDKDGNGKDKEPVFGGLMPGGHRSVKSSKMDPRTAADKAAEEVGLDAALAELSKLG